MRLSIKEMVLIRNYLRSRKAFRNTQIPCGAPNPWEPYMEDLLTKIEDELEVLS